MKTTILKKLLWLTFYSLPLIAFMAHVAEPRAEAVAPLDRSGTLAPAPANRAQDPKLPAKAIIYRYPKRPGDELRDHAVPQRVRREGLEALAVRTYVQNEAEEHGINPKLALWIVKHESQFNPRAKGDGEASRGLWQISKIYHPEVSDAVAFNVSSSTEWSLERIREGKVNEWSTYRFCRTLYKDCPF